MKTTIFVVLTTGLLMVGCGDKENAASTPLNASEVSADTNSQSLGVTASTNESVIAESPQADPTNQLSSPVRSGRRPARTLESVALEKAIQRFNIQEQRFPKDLEELVTKGFVSALPENPPGGRYVYDPTNGQLLLVRD
jgi:hypothetical protein